MSTDTTANGAAAPPRVSVIIPVYNREAFVCEAIESVLAQTFADFELLVVDDGSTDTTRAVVGHIADPRVRLIACAHAGISATMNAGLQAARGELIARLDSDDVWLAELLTTQVAVLDARPEVGVVYGRGRGMEADGRLTAHVWGIAPRYPGDDLRSLLHGDFTCNITVVARRTCLERAGGYDVSLPTNEDWDLWLRVARHCRFAFTDRVLAHFRWHEGNVTSGRSQAVRESREGRVRVLDKFYDQRDMAAAELALRATAYANLHTGTGLLWFGDGEYRAARHSFATALRWAPNPVLALARIIWFLLNWNLLSRYEWGRRFIDWQSATRRRLRARFAGNAGALV